MTKQTAQSIKTQNQGVMLFIAADASQKLDGVILRSKVIEQKESLDIFIL